MKNLKGTLMLKKFQMDLEKERKKAQKLIDKKPNNVMCCKCNKLISKQDATFRYNLGRQEITCYCDECIKKEENY